MNIPPFLQSGDCIGLVAPARKISMEEAAPAVALLEAAGFVVETGKHLYGSHNQFSGTDKERADDINSFLRDKDVKAILSARGGYGCVRIVDTIEWKLIREQPKWICGYSDLSVFLNHLVKNYNTAALHCTMPVNMKESTPGVKQSNEMLIDFLSGRMPEYRMPEHELNRPGAAKGKLVGGNLSVLYSLIGSASFPDTEGSILFLEDLDEYLYHIDRMMQALKRAGKLRGLSALIVGGMTQMNDNLVPYGFTAAEIISEVTSEYDYPVYFDFPAGHQSLNLPLPFGFSAHLSDGLLRFAHS